MAEHLATFVRLHEWRVDQKRRKLGELLRLLDDLESRRVRLEQEVKDEQRVAAGAPDVAGYLYGTYAQAVIDRRHRIAESIAKATEEVEAAREELREAYRELKKFEITQASRNRREAAEQERKDQADLDEVGLQGHRIRRA